MNFWNGIWNWWVVHFLICVHQGGIVFLSCYASARTIAEHLRKLKCCKLCKDGSLLLPAWSLKTVEMCSGLMSLACNWVLLYSLFLRTDFSVCSWRKENSYMLMCLRHVGVKGIHFSHAGWGAEFCTFPLAFIRLGKKVKPVLHT